MTVFHHSRSRKLSLSCCHWDLGDRKGILVSTWISLHYPTSVYGKRLCISHGLGIERVSPWIVSKAETKTLVAFAIHNSTFNMSSSSQTRLNKKPQRSMRYPIRTICPWERCETLTLRPCTWTTGQTADTTNSTLNKTHLISTKKIHSLTKDQHS